MAIAKHLKKTYGTITIEDRNGRPEKWKSVFWSIYKPWAADAANFIKDFGVRIQLFEKKVRGDTVYHVFVPESEMAPIPGILGRMYSK